MLDIKRIREDFDGVKKAVESEAKGILESIKYANTM